MPTYQYACTECDHRFEQFQSFSDDSLTHCPVCDGRLRKVFNAVGVVFKGSGFYRTDSRETPTSGATASSSSGSSGSPSSGSSDGGGSSEGGKPAATPAAAASTPAASTGSSSKPATPASGSSSSSTT